MNIINIIKYQIKYLLKNKVKKYESLLEKSIYDNENIVSKSRQLGMTECNSKIMIRNMYLEIKYKIFINKWKL